MCIYNCFVSLPTNFSREVGGIFCAETLLVYANCLCANAFKCIGFHFSIITYTCDNVIRRTQFILQQRLQPHTLEHRDMQIVGLPVQHAFSLFATGAKRLIAPDNCLWHFNCLRATQTIRTNHGKDCSLRVKSGIRIIIIISL